MTSWGNLCRVCASPADYDIFEKIPVYLHANSKDFLHWQSPIYELMQDTTGLRITRDDGLPQHICALCISYLKHAFTFREKAIEICLNFIAVKEYKEILKGKKEWNYAKAVNEILAPQHNKGGIINDNSTAALQTNAANEEDNTTNCFYKDQNKVNKRLITTGHANDSSNMARVLTNQTKSCLLYLSQLYENPDMVERMGGGQGMSAGFKAKHKRQNLLKSASFDMGGSSGAAASGGFSRKKQNYEDEYPRNISSDEYDEPESNGDSGGGGGSGANGDAATHKNNNIFSYKEKIFEEDDIMDVDELKDLISINIESTCKEHKCKYCSRRFMFEETIQEHLKTCVDFKFTEFFDEIKNLMYIKRCKEISPHEFIRRMIFSIRKTCIWLKENLIDTTLPDLLQSKATIGETTEVDNRSSNQNANEAKTDNILQCIDSSAATAATAPQRRHNPINASNNILHVMSNSAGRTGQTSQKVNKTVIGTSFLSSSSAPIRQTPINISNNILHEIERSEMILKKPIARLATSATNSKCGLNNSLTNIVSSKSPTIVTRTQNPERLAFLEKLQNAAKTITPPPLPLSSSSSSLMRTTPTPVLDSLAPLIAVRQDLLETTTTTTTTTRTRRAHVSPLLELLQNSTKAQNSSNNLLLNPCARCPTCNLLFETLDALEIHNALQHNNNKSCADSKAPSVREQSDNDIDKEAEHKRIIALFENEDEF